MKSLLGNDETKPVCDDKGHPTTSNFCANKKSASWFNDYCRNNQRHDFFGKKENGIANTLMEICQRTCRGC